MKIRLRVRSPFVSADDSASLLESLAARLGEILGEVCLHPADAAVRDGQPRSGYLLDELPEILARLDHVEKNGEGPQFHGGRADASEVVRDPRDLRHNDPHVVATLWDRNSEKLLHGHAVAHVVDQRRHIVEPVRVRDDTVVVDGFRHLLETAVEITDLHVGLLDLLPVELGHDADDPVHGWVRGPDVEHHVPRLEIGEVALRGRGHVRRWVRFHRHD